MSHLCSNIPTSLGKECGKRVVLPGDLESIEIETKNDEFTIWFEVTWNRRGYREETKRFISMEDIYSYFNIQT